MLADLNGVSAERRCHHIPLYSTTSDPVIFTSKNHVTAFKICSTPTTVLYTLLSQISHVPGTPFSLKIADFAYNTFISPAQTWLQSMLARIRTYSIVQGPSWEANWFAASQEIPRISRNPKVHYRTHKRPPPVTILGQPNPVHIPTSHLLEIRPNIIHPSTLRSHQWSLSLRFPHQDPIHPLSSTNSATCPAHLILLDFVTRKILGEEYKSFSSSLCNLLHSPFT